ncbi:MAG: aminomethyl-transferring glycine dehydrogenase subunit GcvPB [Deltaproteobacteria bacterium]|nr:aminomethyl-transferring glycine dehydrogenase subunit GcvPB [Deltaproteobacteria bacterium]
MNRDPRAKQTLEPLLFEKGSPGRRGYSLPPADVPAADAAALYGKESTREAVEGFPEISEIDVVRHYTRLSRQNYGVDVGMYPLGSCTMKYNPKLNEWAARLPEFARSHPLQPVEISQGLLELMYRLEQILCEVSGMARVTLQPAAGAQGELTGMLMVRAYQKAKGNPRKKVLIPDTAHGTNPASCTLCDYEVVSMKTGPTGLLEPREVAAHMDEEVAALMLTNPNTCGLFEKHIVEIAEIVHAKGGLVYFDGANLNALMGVAKPGHRGVDVMHFNLHKTFSTPHGGGGPGSGPVGVAEPLVRYLPTPIVNHREGAYVIEELPESIGKVKSFNGHVGMHIRAYAFALALGGEGLADSSRHAVLNANYLLAKLRDVYHAPYPGPVMHECILTDRKQNAHGVKTLDIAKRLMDYGYHPPTIYFPLVVPGALMIEPTESESLETLDAFADSMRAIAAEAADWPELVTGAPFTTPVARLDEVTAARKPILRWLPE